MTNIETIDEALAMLAMISLAVAAALLYSPDITAVYNLDSIDPETFFEQQDEDEAICTTDSNCILYCPPPADEPQCDGGPEVQPAVNPKGYTYG